MTQESLMPKIRAALEQLDPANDEHWTNDGLPMLQTVQRIANDQTITRAGIQQAVPGYERPSHQPVEPIAPVVETKHIDDDFGAPPRDGTEPEDRELSDDEVHAILTQAVHEADERIHEARNKITEGQAEERAAVQELAQAKQNLVRQFPPLSPAENIKQHIASENARRAARVERGFSPSQVDASMARGNSRGWGRKVRGITGADGTLVKGPDGQVAIPQQMNRPRMMVPPSRT